MLVGNFHIIVKKFTNCNSVIMQSTAFGYGAGGIFISGSIQNLTISNGKINQCSDLYDGGGLMFLGLNPPIQYVLIENSIILGCSTIADNGHGGELYFKNVNSLMIRSTTISNNSAHGGLGGGYILILKKNRASKLHFTFKRC